MVAIAEVGTGRIHVDLGLRYVKGGTVETLQDTFIGVDVPARDADALRSRTDLVTFNAGLVFGF